VNQQHETLGSVQSASEEAASFIKETGNVMDKLDEGTVEDLKLMSNDFKSLMEWKEEQAGIDLVDIRRSQDAIKESLDTVQRDIFDKMPRSEVDSKLESKFEEIIDHLQSALNSTEKDEADFKAVTANLNQVCESLKSDKADKTEIAGLRKQFMQHQSAMMSDMTTNMGETNMGDGPEVDSEEIQEYVRAHPPPPLGGVPTQPQLTINARTGT
jgi:hypothetical protein